MITAIIFDLDGVLVNTEPIHCQSYIEALRKHNIQLTEEEFYNHWTKKGKGIAHLLKERKVSINPSEIRELKRKIYHRLLESKNVVINGASETVRSLYQEFPLALVTSSYDLDANAVLNMILLRKYFKFVVAGNNVSKEKPDPEGFLLAAAQLHTPPKNILVIEDAEKGIIAAHKAGMKSIAIPNELTQDNDFSLANKIVRSIKDITKKLIYSM